MCEYVRRAEGAVERRVSVGVAERNTSNEACLTRNLVVIP